MILIDRRSKLTYHMPFSISLLFGGTSKYKTHAEENVPYIVVYDFQRAELLSHFYSQFIGPVIALSRQFELRQRNYFVYFIKGGGGCTVPWPQVTVALIFLGPYRGTGFTFPF